MGTDRTTCGKCHRKCAGQVLAVGETYFHHFCFTCQECGSELGEDAFYNKDGTFYCSKDYLEIFGERCFKCNQFLEGEVISALGNTFHLDCFSCGQCKKFFPPGENVIFDGRDYVCENCDSGLEPSPQLPLHQCSGCHKEIATGQALMALDQHWHPQCFTCQKCGVILHGEYMGKDGFAFCEKDYQSEFGVVCASCQGYITGKVLQAGDKHYHPQCSRCAKCGQMFGEGEEMYLQGSEIWHPQCSEMVREMERAEKERADRQQRENEEQAYEAEFEVKRREQAEREEKEREIEMEAERREADQRKAEAEKREFERQQYEQQQYEQQAQRREAEQRKAEAERREFERQQYEQQQYEQQQYEQENQRSYQIQGNIGAQVDVNIVHPSTPYEDQAVPPRPAEPTESKDPPAPPTRSDSMGRFAGRNGKPRNPRPKSDYGPSYNNYTDYSSSSSTKYKSSVQVKLTKDDSSIDTSTKNALSPVSPGAPVKFYSPEVLRDYVRSNFHRSVKGVTIKGGEAEKYLNDEDFQKVFKMNREDFNTLPPWKQNDHKIKAGLF